MFYSLKNRLIAFFVLLLVLSFGTMSYLIFQESRLIIRSYIETSALEKMDEYGSFVHMAALQMYDLSSLVFNSEVTSNWDHTLSDPAAGEGEKMLANISLSKFLTHAANSYSGVSSVSLYRRDGLVVSDNNQIMTNRSHLDTKWYRDFVEKSNHWVSSHTDEVELNRSRPYPFISLLLPIGSFEPSAAKTVMKVNVSAEFFLEPLNRIHLGERGTIFLLDHEGHPMLSQEQYAPHEEAARKVEEIRNGNTRQGVVYLRNPAGSTDILVYKKLKQNGWMLVGFVTEADLYANLYRLRTTIVLFSSFLLIAAIVVATWLSYGITKPLSRLASAMRSVQKGEFDLAENRIPPERSVRNEVGFVTSSFRNMVRQLKQHIQTEFELKLLRQQAEYKALLMQINPHFLFNTLELLSSLSVQRKTAESLKIIEALGKMLRFSLNAAEDLVSLRQEIDYLRYYLTILEIRFGDRLRLSLRVDGEPGNREIVKFILQPLVENAVKYSFAEQAVAEVDIRISVEPERVRLLVADNGPGMPPGLAERLYAETAHSRLHDVLNRGSGTIGLRNVLARCRLYYGQGFEYAIRSADSGPGTTIELILPIGEGASDVSSADRG
ncbi:sensor histidine kinase [Paenibacillus thermoaerophilus]|uniref:Sensor histidine kinase n=1 Tax=Paenibacillus thermoaerophilus TaxID=1215385 RepID=A0ABW2V906_9BACL|nr:histidine kinase [Paenibacillus thermoaerophilus]TMV06664.1 sensor histidine kinase [Paenibacillus thermoaerophilus]